MKRILSALALLPFAAGLAAADVLHLKNGRTMEGTVVAKKKTTVVLKVPGGTLKIPRSTIKRIEERLTPQDEYAHRAATTDMSDPKAIEGLAHWASRRGLGEQSKQLRKMAQGVALQQRVDALRSSRSGQAWLALSVWAKNQRHSTEVQRYLVGKALEVEPNHEGARLALQKLQTAERRRLAWERRRKRAKETKAKPPSKVERETQKERKRLTALEKKLEEQKDETQVLRDRILQLEREKQERLREDRQRRVRNQRRRRAGSRYRGRYVPPRPASPYYVPTR